MKPGPVLLAAIWMVASPGIGPLAEIRAAEAPTPPALRLPAGARPVQYAVDLTLSPESETFSGAIDIDLEMDAPVRVLWLNATDLTVGDASFTIAGRTVRPRVVPGGDDFIGFETDDPVGPGRAGLHISYTGKSSEKELSGIFRQKEGDDWYIFTQFEATDARKAFPCFDEPAYKVPWKITLHVKKGLSAVSNSPIASETESPDGMKSVRFAETKPLPSYLVALGVGPFDFAEGPPVGSKHVPFRVVVPKGQAASASYTVQSTPDLVALLEKYFGTPYPYDKLDFLAVPLMGGAMENAGLITFGRRLILTQPEEERLERQRSFAAVTAHELAHMWFGDLVTMKWWDDIWLNESFASWIEYKIVEQWKPDWDAPVDRVQDRNRAISVDRLISARRIRQPIESSDDIQNAFDPITYEKGSAILTMLEQWIGAERFQKAVQRHLAAHAWGSADAADFFASLSGEAGKEVEPVFRSFVDQGGIPLVTVRVVCAKGSPPSLELAQRRYLPVGSKGSADQVWKFPVCVRYGSGENVSRQCTLLAEPSAKIQLGEVPACPDWLLPNDGAMGYYLARFGDDAKPDGPAQPGSLARLFDDGGRRLSVPERIGVLADLSALVSAGKIPTSEVLSLLPSVIQDGNRHTLTLAAGIVGGLRLNLVPPDLLPNYQRFLSRTFAARARELGMKGRPGESEDTQMLRPTLISLVAEDGEDAELQKEARALALGWLDDHNAVPAEMVDVVLSAGMRHATPALFDRLHAAARKASDRTERGHLFNGMASFQDPKIVRKRLSLLLTDEFDLREANNLLWAGFGEPASREIAYAFLKDNYPALMAKIPKDYEAYFAFAGESFCDEAHRQDVEVFFGKRTSEAPGGPRILAQVLEQIDLCIARKKVQQASIDTFLRKQ